MNRMRELRQQLGISMKEAASKIGLPYTTYVNYEKGDREPNSETLIAIADLYDTSIDYLICRDTNTLRKTAKMPLKATDMYSMSEHEHIKKYRTLDEYGKQAVDAVLKIEHKRCSENTEVIPDSAIAARGGILAPRGPVDEKAFQRDIANLRDEDEPDL